MSEALFLGLISGTSMDGVDAALARFGAHEPVETVRCRTFPYPEDLRARLLAAIAPAARLTLHELGTLDVDVGRHFADAALALLREANVASRTVNAIGSHGQTIRHHPLPPTPYSLQIGCGATIAARTGIVTVADFRRLDIACGGEGAPLVPPFHAACMGSADEDRIVVNIGGITNLSLIPKACDTATLGFDTGPGNCLMDEWVARHRGTGFDEGGAWAASGRVVPALLDALLAQAYFAQTPPKSTGRELFNLALVERALADLQQPATTLDPADVQSTLCELTVESLACSIEAHVPGRGTDIYVCGGGARNKELMTRLARRLTPRAVLDTDALGIDAGFIEALAFAWYARRRMSNVPTRLTTSDTPHAICLGAVHAPCSVAET